MENGQNLNISSFLVEVDIHRFGSGCWSGGCWNSAAINLTSDFGENKCNRFITRQFWSNSQIFNIYLLWLAFGSDLAPPHCASSIPSTFPGPYVRTALSCEFTLVVELVSVLVLLFGIAPPPLFAPTILPVQPAAPGSGRPGAAPWREHCLISTSLLDWWSLCE